MAKRLTEKINLPLYLKEPLRFECTRCGACCTSSGDYYVYLSHSEIEKIGDFLAVSRAWFKRRYLQNLPENGWVLVVNTDKTCVFLDKDKRCRIYPVRPGQCLSYPYWPEVVLRKKDWMSESRRCEGIGRGGIVSKKTITALLELVSENEV